jgi:hypothetical protein
MVTNQVGYYTLWVGRDGSDMEGMATVPYMTPLGKRSHQVGGFSDIRTRSTTLTFTRKSDRDHAKEWLRLFAHERGLKPSSVI